MKAGRKRWMLDLRYLGGAREFYETEDAAVTARRVKLDQVKQHGAAALALTNEERLDFTRARDELAKFNATIAQAVEFFKKHHSVLEPVSFQKAIDEICVIKAGAKKDAEYVRKLRANLESLMQATGGDRDLSNVTREQIERWLFKNAWAQDTKRNKRIDVRTFFHFAQKRNWIVANPAAHLESIARTNKPPGILKVDECLAALTACAAELPNFLPYLTLGLFAGIRCEEAVKLTPENLQLHRGFVEVPAYRGGEEIAKSRKRRIVNLAPAAAAWLKNAAPLVPASPKWYARQLPKLRLAAAPVLAKLRQVEKVSFPWPKNCLRHSFCSYHIAMHESADVTATLMGHEDTKMLYAQYRELVTKAEADRFWKLVP